MFRKAYDSIKLLKSNLKDKHKPTPPLHNNSNAANTGGEAEEEGQSNYVSYMANKLSENSP